MTFPAVPRDVTTELYLNGDWVDVSTDVRTDVRDDPGIIITHGRPNESGKPQPSICHLTFDNDSGNYSPRNPLGDYYGQLGRNTPMRVSVTQVRDAFGRTVVSGLGSTDTGHPWTTSGAWSVSGGLGRRDIAAAGTYAQARLETLAIRDVDIAVTFTLPFSDVAGNWIRLGVLLRGESSTDVYEATVEVTTTETVRVGVLHFDGTVIAPLTTVTGLTHTAAQSLRLRVQSEGQTLRAKAWAVGSAEPYGWHAIGRGSLNNVAGFAGLFVWAPTGNTNTYPFTITFDNVVMRQPRCAPEISVWPQRWDITGTDMTAPVEAAGILRRLGQGTSPVQSTMYRGVISLSTQPVAYWPGEDGSDASVVSSAIGGPPMIVSGATDFATYTDIAASAPLPVMDGGTWIGEVPFYAHTGQVMLRFLSHVTSSILDGHIIAQLFTAGSAHHWELKFATGGSLRLQAWTSADVNILDSGPLGSDVVDTNMMLSIELTQNGSNIDWELGRLDIDTGFAGIWSGTVNSRTIGRATRVAMSPFGFSAGITVGHIHVRKEAANLFDLEDPITGYAGELAANRIERLCSEADVPFSLHGDPAMTVAMGPQRAEDLQTLLNEAAEADGGTLYDSRGELGLTYRTRSSVYNQPVTLTLDYDDDQVAPPFEPTDDDQLTRNDVTVIRRDGGYARAELVTGRMSVLSPAEGGVGRYDTQVTLNVETDGLLDDIAGWALHEGTVDDTRYPVVRVDLTTSGMVNDPAASIAVLDIAVDDCFEIVNPLAGQTPDDITQIARGYSEHISSFAHSLVLNAAPGEPYSVLRSDGDPTHPGKLSTDDSTLASGVTSSATSLSVATTSGTLWTTSAGDMPVEIPIGGERMSVTAISGTSSPQTFTVTRSVNGVVKAHSAGADVSLTRRATLAR